MCCALFPSCLQKGCLKSTFNSAEPCNTEGVKESLSPRFVINCKGYMPLFQDTRAFSEDSEHERAVSGLLQFCTQCTQAQCSAASFFTLCHLDRSEARFDGVELCQFLLCIQHSTAVHCAWLFSSFRHTHQLFILRSPNCPCRARSVKCARRGSLAELIFLHLRLSMHHQNEKRT